MTNPLRGSVSLPVGDRTYTLSFSVNALCVLEDELKAPIGKVVGPLPGPDAYWVIRVNARTPSRAAPSVSDARTRELVKQDYVAYRFLQWANDVVAKAKVE